jgi:hypothetical protein
MRFIRRGAMMFDKVAILPEGGIAAGRFVLRPVRRSDAGLFAMYAGDRRVAEATRSIPHPLPPGAADAFVTRATSGKSDEDVWVMDGSSTGLARRGSGLHPSIRHRPRQQPGVVFR